MARTRTTYYRAEPAGTSTGTDFQYATDPSDPFNYLLDMSFVAQALDRHDHRDGRGLAVGRIDAGAITASALASNSVATAAIQDLAVTTAKLADNAVTTAKIVNGTIKGEDMEPTAVVDRLGYTPVNKAGDTNVGGLSFANNAHLTLTAAGSLVMGTGNITTGGTITVNHVGGGGAADFKTSDANSLSLRLQHTGTIGQSAALGILDQPGLAYLLLLNASAAAFTIPVQARTVHSTVATGTAPFTATSTTICPNLNAQYLNGQPSSYYGRAANEVPSGAHALFQTAASIPAGWDPQHNLDGRILVGSGTAAGVGVINFNENAHAGTSWSVTGGSHTHTLNQHQHFHNNMPNATGVAGPGGQYVLLGIDYGANSWPGGDTATGSTGGASSWNFPTYAMVLARKT